MRNRHRLAATDLSYVLGWFEYEPEIYLSEDIEWGYFKLIDTEQKAREYNYHSDYWGDAEGYQEENVDLMGALEPYVGKAVTFRDYIDGEFTLLGIAIDRQYNSVSHTCVVVRENEKDAKRAFMSGYMAGSVKKAAVELNQHLIDYYEDEARDMVSQYDWETIVAYMDEEIAERLHDELAPIDNLSFLIAYIAEHEIKYGEDFVL